VNGDRPDNTARKPRIGIITPSLNQGRYIRETIKSILRQNYPTLEYWVVDGGSTDDTIPILESLGSRINWISGEDDGQAQAINKGLKRVSAEIVAFLNSDDVYLPGTLDRVSQYFQSHPEAVWLTGDHFIIDESGRRIQSFIVRYKRLLRRSPTFGKLAVANFIVQPSTFWRRSFMDDLGLFDESLAYCFDYDFWLRAILRQPLHVIPTPLSLFRIHGKSKGGSQFQQQFSEEYRVLKRYTRSQSLLGLHRLHTLLVVFAYRFLKR